MISEDSIPQETREIVARFMEPQRHYEITRITTWTVRPSSPLSVRKTAAFIRQYPKLAGIWGLHRMKPRGHWEIARDLVFAGIAR